MMVSDYSYKLTSINALRNYGKRTLLMTLHLFSWHFQTNQLVLSAFKHIDTTQKLQESCRYIKFIQYAEVLPVRHVETMETLLVYGPRCSLNGWVFRLQQKKCGVSAFLMSAWSSFIVVEPGQQTVLILSAEQSGQAGVYAAMQCRRTLVSRRPAKLLHSGWAADVGWHIHAQQPGVTYSSLGTR